MGNVMRIDDNHGHVTSKDYAALFGLMQKQPVVCIVDYSRGGAPGDEPCRDIASTLYSDYPSYQVSARGIGYVHAFSEDEFVRQCAAVNLEWLVPGEVAALDKPAPTGAELIAAERKRQIEQEGWTPEHDEQHFQGELALAGAIYAWPQPRPVAVKKAWPWDRSWWKPMPIHGTDGRIRELVKAGALIAAEIDRLQKF